MHYDPQRLSPLALAAAAQVAEVERLRLAKEKADAQHLSATAALRILNSRILDEGRLPDCDESGRFPPFRLLQIGERHFIIALNANNDGPCVVEAQAVRV